MREDAFKDPRGARSRPGSRRASSKDIVHLAPSGTRNSGWAWAPANVLKPQRNRRAALNRNGMEFLLKGLSVGLPAPTDRRPESRGLAAPACPAGNAHS